MPRKGDAGPVCSQGLSHFQVIVIPGFPGVEQSELKSVCLLQVAKLEISIGLCSSVSVMGARTPLCSSEHYGTERYKCPAARAERRPSRPLCEDTALNHSCLAPSMAIPRHYLQRDFWWEDRCSPSIYQRSKLAACGPKSTNLALKCVGLSSGVSTFFS